MIATAKFQIIKPTNIDWKQFGDILFTIQKETREIMNKTIQLCWEWQGFSSDYKEKYSIFPKEKDILTNKKNEPLSLSGYINTRLNEDYLMYSSNNSQSQQRAIKRWKSDSKDVFIGKKSITSYKQDLPIDLHNKSIEINYDDNKKDYFCKLKLLNRSGVKKFGMDSSVVEVLLSVKDNSQKQILNRIILGEYKIGGSQLVKHKTKKKWFLNLNYQFELDKKEKLERNNILGIDMGIVYPIYMAVNNSLKREKIGGGEIEHFRKGVESRRISLLNQGKYCGNGRIGHGRKTRIKPIEKLSEKVKNFRKTCNEKYARFVIEFAKKNNCGIIQMEDLSGIADGEKKATFLGAWTYYDLQQKIKYGAEKEGIEVKLINPRYTSQRCSQCGFIHTDNRPKGEKGQSYFKCINCDFETNADYNAAKNIATPNIEQIIKEQIQKQEEELKNAIKYIAE